MSRRGGAQELYGIDPDLSTFGKVIGGGLPVGAYGGRRDIMQMIAPSGPVYQAGTLSGNPLAMTAGIETLKIIDEDENFYANLEEISSELENRHSRCDRRAGFGLYPKSGWFDVHAILHRVRRYRF